MLKRLVVALAVFASVAVAQQAAPDPLAGAVVKHVYTSSYFSFQIEIPFGWKSNLEGDWNSFSDVRERISLRARSEQAIRREHLLLFAAPVPLHAADVPLLFLGSAPDPQHSVVPSSVEPRYLMVQATPVLGDAIAARDQEIEKARKGSVELTVAAEPTVIDRIALTRVDIIRQAGKKRYQRVLLLTVRQGHVLVFNFTANNQKEMENLLAKTLPTLHFN